MNRTSVLYGPAFITWNSYTFFSKGDIVMRMGAERFKIDVSPWGSVQSRLAERVLEIEFVPCGEWEAASKTGLFPFRTHRIGQSLLESTDKDLVITPLDGKEPFTLKNACLSQMPSLTFRATETLLGSVRFMVLGANDTDWSEAESLFAIGADISDPSTIDLSAFSLANIITKGYSAQWTGITGFAPFEGQEGFEVSFPMGIAPFGVDSTGIIDYRLTSLEVQVSCIPVGPTAAQLTSNLKLQGTGAKRGAPTDIIADLLILDGESEATVFTAHNMSLISADVGYGQRPRFGQATWESNRQPTSSASLTAPFTIA